jgi:hypothetical protein
MEYLSTQRSTAVGDRDSGRDGSRASCLPTGWEPLVRGTAIMGLLSRNARSSSAWVAVVVLVDATSGRSNTDKHGSRHGMSLLPWILLQPKEPSHVFCFPRPGPHGPGLYVVELLKLCSTVLTGYSSSRARRGSSFLERPRRTIMPLLT